MSGKLKGLLVVLALGALVSGAYTVSLFRPSSSSDSDTLSASQLAALQLAQKDTDQDGLSDQEETYWGSDYRNADTDGDGYKDGEEVLSGHDPAKKGPNDFLNPKQNLTQQAGKVILGALANGDLKGGSTTYQQVLDAIVASIFQQYQSTTTTPPDRITTGPSTANDVLMYGLTQSRLLKKTLTETATGYGTMVNSLGKTSLSALPTLATSDRQRWTLFISAVDQEISALDDRIATIQAVIVPTTLAQTHRNVLAYLRSVQQQYRSLHNVDTDPVRGTIAYSVLGSLVTETSLKLSADFSEKLSKALQQ